MYVSHHQSHGFFAAPITGPGHEPQRFGPFWEVEDECHAYCAGLNDMQAAEDCAHLAIRGTVCRHYAAPTLRCKPCTAREVQA